MDDRKESYPHVISSRAFFAAAAPFMQLDQKRTGCKARSAQAAGRPALDAQRPPISRSLQLKRPQLCALRPKRYRMEEAIPSGEANDSPNKMQRNNSRCAPHLHEGSSRRSLNIRSGV